MNRRSKTMGPSRPVKMGLLMRFLCFTFIGRAIALASSDIAADNSPHLSNEIKNSNKTKSSTENNNNSPNETTDVHNRKSRAIPPSKTLASLESPEENYLEFQANNMDDKPFTSSISDELDKMAFPMIRFRRSGSSMIPTLRFGRSGTSMIPTIRFGRSSSSMIPTIRFGRSSSSMIPTIRFGRSSSSMIPTIRFGRSSSSMIPTIRFGRSDNSMIPMPRYGRAFENSEDGSLEENLVGMETDEDERLEEKNDSYENNVNYIDDANVNDDEISNINSEETSNSMDFINKILKRQTNESMIPQIRYGRSALKAKIAKAVKSPFFILPNIRPGRSPDENLNMPEEASEPYFSDVQGFLGLFGAFRRSDDDFADDSRNLQELELGKKVEDFLFDANADQTYKEMEKQHPLYVIPYPRPGKRQLRKYPSTQKDNEENYVGSTTHLFKINKISDYVLPYPRPGKKRQGPEEILKYTRSKRSASIVPYPRPGRSSSILPYPRPGRSSSILPYPRPGRSSSILPYPRPGRSSSILPYPRPGRSMAIVPYPRPGRSFTEGNYMLPYPRPGRSDGNYMLPYPRPGRSKQSSFDDYEADKINNQLESQKELKRAKRSAQNYELTYMLNPASKETVGNVDSDLEHFDSVQQGIGESESKLAGSHDAGNFLRKFKGHEPISNPIYILPYPRPGRDV